MKNLEPRYWTRRLLVSEHIRDLMRPNYKKHRPRPKSKTLKKVPYSWSTKWSSIVPGKVRNGSPIKPWHLKNRLRYKVRKSLLQAVIQYFKAGDGDIPNNQ